MTPSSPSCTSGIRDSFIVLQHRSTSLGQRAFCRTRYLAPMPGDPEHTDLAALRVEYGVAGLTEADAGADPMALWRRWYADAGSAGLHEPNAMVVATVSPDGQPSARMVLLKGVTDEGF